MGFIKQKGREQSNKTVATKGKKKKKKKQQGGTDSGLHKRHEGGKTGNRAHSRGGGRGNVKTNAKELLGRGRLVQRTIGCSFARQNLKKESEKDK